MEQYLKVIAVGAACIYAAQFVAGTEMFQSQSNPTVQKLMYYGAGGAALVLAHKVFGSAVPVKAPG